MVLAAADQATPTAAEALEALCQAYWLPLYFFVRRQGYEVAQAQDLTQAFFERLLEKNYLAQVHPEKGRFRSFLLAALRHFLADQRDYNTAAKRGGGACHLSLNMEVAEATYAQAAIQKDTPETLYERHWALAVVERARNRLRAEYMAMGKGGLFLELGEVDESARAAGYAEVGLRLGMSENAVKIAAFRLRRRYQELVRAEIAETLMEGEDIDDEIRHILQVLSA
jgi:RNA polymerase sigma-70 factor (ECF subfamily)